MLEVNRAFSAGKSSLFHESWGVAPGSEVNAAPLVLKRDRQGCLRHDVPTIAVLLPLEVREGAFRFAGERFLKATG